MYVEALAPRFVVCLLSLLLFLRTALGGGDPSCWMDGVTREQCCLWHLPNGNPSCFDATFTFERCCGPPPKPKPVAKSSWQADCIESDVVFRHAGEHGLFADVRTHGHEGCFLNDCSKTDKFVAEDRGVCARLCDDLEECTHWSYGAQEEKDGSQKLKCFLRKSADGRDQEEGWSSGAKECIPAPIPAGFAALTIADNEALAKCDKGKSDECPDILPAIQTWKLMYKFLFKAISHGVDQQTKEQTTQLAAESAGIADQVHGEYRPNDNPPDMPRTTYNNRLIVGSFRDWLVQHPKAVFSSEDTTLPLPLRTGLLCGNFSCY